jgi:Na+-transporting NADH:ubiquinone oxidoreductase subunit C
VNTNGEKTGADAFTVDLKAEFGKPVGKLDLRVFVSPDNGSKKYIFPVRGAGLWGPIWGYVSLNDDFKTVYGAVFDHQGETPGLGAEIATPAFQQQFQGKSLYDNNGTFMGIRVVKPGTPVDNTYTVDGISGGTITSKALEKMVFDCLSNYKAFFAAQTQNKTQEQEIPAQESQEQEQE